MKANPQTHRRTLIRNGLWTLAAAGLLAGAQAPAASVDLTGWTAEGGSSSWNVEDPPDGVLQTVNGAPTVFFDPTVTSAQNTSLSGTIEVQTTGDDDFLGFVLGYESGEIFSDSADYFLIDWKQGTQSGWDEGLAISHVTDGSNGNTVTTSGSFWQHTPGEVDLITRAENLGDTGWANNTEFLFDLIFTSTMIEVRVVGVTEISITPGDAGLTAFSDGAFGFYNYSQEQVRYSSIVETTCEEDPTLPGCEQDDEDPSVPVPAPGPLALLAAGLLGMRLMRRAGGA